MVSIDMRWAMVGSAVILAVQFLFFFLFVRRLHRFEWVALKIDQRRTEAEEQETVRRVITSRALVVGALQTEPAMVSVDDAAKAVSDWLAGR